MIEDEEHTNPRIPVSPQEEQSSDVDETTRMGGPAQQPAPTPSTAPAQPSQPEEPASPPSPEVPEEDSTPPGEEIVAAEPVAAPAEEASENIDPSATIQVLIPIVPAADRNDLDAKAAKSDIYNIAAGVSQSPQEAEVASEAGSEPTAPTAPPPPIVAAPIVSALPYMNVDDLLALKIASDPQISPTGTEIAFVLQQNIPQRNATASAIWLVNSAGGKANPPRQLTSGDAHDRLPRWSPDGQSLAFVSDRSGTSQLYLLPLVGGEARQISSLSQGVTEYSWHPGGKLLLAHSYWKPGDEAEFVDAEEAAEEMLATVYTRLEGRKNVAGEKLGYHLQLWLVPLDGKVTRLTSEPVDLQQSCWSPDGTEVVFCANRRSDPDLTRSKALWVLTLATGQLRRLTPEDGWAQMPAWSPDGQWIAYLFTPDQTEAGNIAPWIVAARGEAIPQLVVPDAEQLTCQSWVIDELRTEWLARPQWYPDSVSVLVAAQERGQVHLYRLDRAGNTLQRLTNGNGRYVSPQLSRNGQVVTMVRADWFTPGDVWCMDGEGQGLRKLTRVNDVILQSHQLIRPKRITWQSFDGLTIEGWLYLPPYAGQTKVPLILAPHGGPALAWGDSYVHEFQVLAGRGYAVLAPNPRGSAGYGEEFSRKAFNDWGGDDWRDLLAGLDYVLATEPIDGERLGIDGMSYGGYLTNWALTQTSRFKAAVSRNGWSSLETVMLLSDHTVWFALSMADEERRRERSPLTLVDHITTPLLLLHADQDLNCPVSEARQLFAALRRRKRPVELVCYHNASHLMDWPGVGTPRQRVDRLQRTFEWFARFV
jgi:dipeptidyl aminopeptidase/acylaminoacyl peptidase